MGVFYANNGMVGSRESNWIQHAMTVLYGLFRRYGLAANVEKSCIITCHTGALRAGMLEESMALKCTGVVDLYQVRLQRRIPCLYGVVELTAGSMMAHRRRMQETEPAINWIRLMVRHTVHQPQVYNTRFPRTMKQCPCPFPG